MSAWSYNAFRAMLERNGKPFAIVTPDGRNALSKVDERLLLDALNRNEVKTVNTPAPLTNHELAL